MILCQDEILRGLLRKLSRHPWDQTLWGIVHDRLQDLGHDWPNDHYLKVWRQLPPDLQNPPCSRRNKARHLRVFRRVLECAFGDFEYEPSELPF